MSPLETIFINLSVSRVNDTGMEFVKTAGAHMTDATIDRAKFMIFPPVIPYSALAIACILQWLEPLGLVVQIERDVRIWLGLLIVVAGMAMMFAGQRALLRHGTNINPLRPTTALVTDGVFRRTRNPLYVGVSVALCGGALIFALDWMLILIIPAFAVLHFAVVRREELYLEQKFGDAYRLYKEKVPRYLID
jgi:protein-S-isoprenylcysteine O-methyltransferase Ste14